MRSPVTLHHSAWLATMIVLILTAPLWADAPGEITGVKLEPEKKSITITSKGTVGKHWGRVIGQPNRLVLDFSDTKMGQVPAKISGNANIHEIRLGQTKTRARLVVDFQNNPVPSFNLKRENGRILIVFGKSLAEGPSADAKNAGLDDWKKSAGASPSAPSFVPAAARSSQDEGSAALPQAPVVSDQKRNPRRLDSAGKTIQVRTEAPAPALNDIKVAQNVDSSQPVAPTPAPRSSSQNQGDATRNMAAAPPRGPASGGPQMVREVRPPVTPPTPDPRLLVQEITELQFIQVGHNARLVVRGGDHLDYRMNKVSPTKLKLDLINAEIPKVHQKPLKTDLFSTSVEMIVPGSQTIFIQLKDAVPYQVEKKKGVLMIDFPPPRFEMTRDQLGTLKPGSGDQAGREAAVQMRETRREAVRIMKEEEIVRANESRTKDIQALQRQQEELQKQRTEIIKRYQISPDPEIFNKPVTMDFQGISLRNAFRLLAEQAGINIIVGNEVTGTTTLRLFQVPLGQVIETILNTHGLDREMVGNVMRVGQRAQIAQYKGQRQQEYQRRIGEVDRRIKEIAEQISKKQAENDKMLKELERKEARAEEAADETRTEEVGEAECIDMDGERVCFQYATIRMVYRVPSTIVPTLNCVFNLQCGAGSRGRQQYAVTSQGVLANPSLEQTFGAGASGARGDIQTLQASQAGLQQRQTMGTNTYAADLTGQGFQPGSPGFESRMETQRRLVERQESSDARMQVAAAQSQMALGRGSRASIDLPFGTDPRMARILAQSILWADDANRILYIKDTPERIAQMKKLIYQLDIPIPQVLIESRLVQATRDWSRGVGIIWGGRQDQSGYLSGFKQNFWGLSGGAAAGTPGTITQGAPAPPQPQGTLITPNFMVNLPAVAGSLMGATLQYGFLGSNYLTELDFRLQLGEANGQTKVIARPKVQVLDGQAATIKNGRTIAYQTVSADGTQTQLVPVDLLLSVTPTIFADGRIRMVIKVTDNDVGGIVNGVSEILTREASTIMIVKDGETAVIGGTIRKTDNETKNGWPGLMNVPGINFLFSNKNRSKQITELLVFVTPTVIRRPPTAS